jgi:hypothetical protein
VGAKYEIYQLIIDLANEGKGVIMVSSEMPELLGVLRPHPGHVGRPHSREVDAKNTSQEEILTWLPICLRGRKPAMSKESKALERQVGCQAVWATCC